MSAAPGPPLDPDALDVPAHVRPGLVALVALGGFAGAPLRYALAHVLPGPDSGWPTATFVTNLVGALLLGLLLATLGRREETGPRRRLRLLLGTGLIGAFTTYSTFVVEVDELLLHAHADEAIAYALASVVGGVLLAGAGLALGGRRGTASR